MTSLVRHLAAIAFAATLSACAATPLRETAFRIEENFGHRPMIDATLNGFAYRLMVHANSGSYIQVNHAEAARIGVTDMVHKGAYGIQAPGEVSDLGRDDGRLALLTVADVTLADVPIAVFERPSAGSEGMAGLPFLTLNRAIIDYRRNVLILPRDAAEAVRYGETLAALGYAPHRLVRDAGDGRYLVTVQVGAVARAFVVSTVANTDIDTAFAAAAGIAAGPVSGRWGGPSGTQGETRETAAPLTISIGAWTSQPDVASIYDLYAYAEAPRPADPAAARGGQLGASFLMTHQAVVDFGQGLLWLR